METVTTREPCAKGRRQRLEIELPDDRAFIHIVPRERFPDIEASPDPGG